MNVTAAILVAACVAIYLLARACVRHALGKVAHTEFAREAAAACTDPLDSVSLQWAWGTQRRLRLACRHADAEVPRELPEPRRFKTESLSCGLGILLVVLYQRRWRDPDGPRLCNYWPNCSAYAIGVFRRFRFIPAVRLTLARIRRCDGRANGLDLSVFAKEQR